MQEKNRFSRTSRVSREDSFTDTFVGLIRSSRRTRLFAKTIVFFLTNSEAKRVPKTLKLNFFKIFIDAHF